jgi:zinc protease
MGFRGLTIADPDRIALEVLAQTLAGQGGRLFLELRDRQGLAYTVSAVNVEGLAPGFFAVYIATAPDKLGAARRGMREELERIVQEAPDAGELERAQRYLVGNFAIDEQRSGTRALHMALDARYELGADASRHYPERVRAVTRDDLLRVAQRLIDFDTCTVALVGPPGVSGQ